MSAKKWIKLWFIIIILIPIIGGLNYIIDPYGIYNSEFFDFEKIKANSKMRLIKVIEVLEIKPASICLGTSRTEYAYDPNHPYFIKPSFNFAVSSGSMYEIKKNFEFALKQKKLKKVLLVVDYRMFNEPHQKDIHDFDSYFDNPKLLKFKYLFSTDTLKDAIFTIIGTKSPIEPYLSNGQHIVNFKTIKDGHLKTMINNEKIYYKGFPTNYTYKDTGKKSFPDFEYIVKKCYENNITLDIIFGPSHIRQWESLAYFLGYDKWLKWKKDVIVSVNKIANKYNKKPFRIMDFAIYYDGITNEKIPTEPNKIMKYYRESSHYTVALGNIVLNRLIEKSEYQDFGVELNLDNIDQHLEKLKQDRIIFINIKAYRKQVFGH